MAFVPRAQATSAPKETRTLYFGDVRGVDFRSEDTTSYRSPESVNMYHSRRGYWETHPGFRSMGNAGAPIYGMHKFIYKDKYDDILVKVLIHAGSRMYLWDNYPNEFTPNTLTEIFNGLAQRRTKYVEFDEELVIMDGDHIYYFDGEVMDYVSHAAYVPQIYTGKSPSAATSEDMPERQNFLTPYVIEGFVPEKNESDIWETDYRLSATDLDATPVYAWRYEDGEKIMYTEDASGDYGFTVDRTAGIVTFNTAPQYEIPGVENVYIKYAKTHGGYLDRIDKCTEMLVFDRRMFLTGNPAFPNVIFWSGVNDFTYWDILNYSDTAGRSSACVTALQYLQENKFLSIKEDSNQEGSYSVWSPYDLDLDSYVVGGATLYKTYVNATGVSTKGVVSPHAHTVFLDDNVFLSSNGLNAISRNIAVSNERNVEHRSTLVDPKLLAEDLPAAIITEHRDYLYILFPNGHCYMANSQLKNDDVSNNIEYEWAYMEFDHHTPPTQMKSFNDQELYIGFRNGKLVKFYFDKESSDGAFPNYTYNFDGEPINDYVDTPFSWFGVQNRFKKLNRKYNDLYCDIKTKARVEVLYHTEKTSMPSSKVLPFKADVFSFSEVNFENVKPDEWDDLNQRPVDGWKNPKNFTFNAIPPASFVLRKLKGKRFRRLQIRVKSAAVNCPVTFKSLVVEAYIVTRKLK